MIETPPQDSGHEISPEGLHVDTSAQRALPKGVAWLADFIKFN